MNNEEIIQKHMDVYGITEDQLIPGEKERVLFMYERYHTDVKKFELKKSECILLVVDMQNNFVDAKGGSWCPEALRQVPRIKKLIEAFREIGIPVLYTQTHMGDDCCNLHPNRAEFIKSEKMLYEDTWGADFYPELAPRAGERVIKSKHTPDSFLGTDLDFIMRDTNVKTIIICGTNTDICCETTARSASSLHYNVVVGSDVCSAYYGEAHEAALPTLRFSFARVMKSDLILQELKND